MTSRYVAIDTETTGLDAEHDEIIEVAAIAFDGERVLGEYNTLVRPRMELPYHVHRLTGIDAAALETAPHFAAIASELAEFIGDSPVIGQSVDFDRKFLAGGGVWPSGPSYDTYDLARLLLPGLADYSLRTIAERLEVDFPVRHRALADADATRSVFLELRRRLGEQPGWLLAELERLATASDWQIVGLIRELMREHAGEPLDITAGLSADLLAPVQDIAKALGAGREAEIDEGEVISLLRRVADMETFGEFEQRPEQETMARAVNRAFSQGGHLLVEAGTGTGKSLAYLLPAALQAIRRGERVVVSTDTIGLQEQLMEKDLPVVQALLAQVEPEPLRVASLKGRRNYLCLQRWTAARHQAPASAEEAQLMARLLIWLQQTQTGDRADLNLHNSFDAAWNRLAAENTACIQTQCPFVRNGTCFLVRARKRAEAAHILVVNHALLLSDVATGGHVLPAYDRLIIDEAHNLEDEATSRFAFRATESTVSDFLDRVGRRGERTGGLAGALQDSGRGQDQLMGPGTYVASLSAALVTAAAKARSRLHAPFGLITRALKECAREDRDTEDRLLITRATRVQSIWSDVEIAYESLDGALIEVVAVLDNLSDLLSGPDMGLIDQDTLANEASDLAQTGAELQRGLNMALLEDDGSLICWLDRARNSNEVAVCTAPLSVDEILRRDLFEAKQSVVLTSATISAEDSFDFIRQRIGLDDADELLLGSPFDFEKSTMIALPGELPDPNDPGFVAAMSELLVEAVRASRGRALVLFTSYGQLRAVYEEVKAPLEAEGILVLAHGTDGSPRQLLSALRENSRTVILGTSSFWEGVDVAGDALSLLVIVRLPFAVPTDPIYQARSGLYDEPFDQYALPQAILRFRQGFGRLIRTKTDRGVLLVLDRRIRGRRYGESFLRSLPRCTLRELPARHIPGAIESWLA